MKIHKSITISEINLEDGQQELTQEVQNYLKKYDFYSKTQCLVNIPGDGDISYEEGMLPTPEDGQFLADAFSERFPMLYLDFNSGAVKFNQTMSLRQIDSEEDQNYRSNLVERSLQTLIGEKEKFYFLLYNESLPENVTETWENGFNLFDSDFPEWEMPTALNEMGLAFRDCASNYPDEDPNMIFIDAVEYYSPAFININQGHLLSELRSDAWESTANTLLDDDSIDANGYYLQFDGIFRNAIQWQLGAGDDITAYCSGSLRNSERREIVEELHAGAVVEKEKLYRPK